MSKRPIGHYVQPGTMEIKTSYYDIRYNKRLAFMNNKPLGLQVLVNYLNDFMWINIDDTWIE
jgi:hypothetical protein